MESLTDGREQMLARIREALGRPARPRLAPEPLPRFPAQTGEGDAAGRVAQFVSELEKVGAGVTRAGSADEVKECLERLLPESPDAPVALSDGAALRRLGLRAWLAGAGRPVVPSLREFIAEAGGAPDPQASDGREVAALVERHRGLLLDAAVGITTADYAIADTGTVVIVSGGEQHRLISLLPPTHVCLLDPARVLPSLTHLLAGAGGAFGDLGAVPKNITCITGPSRTADIEQAITMGVHGPKSLHVILHPTAG